MKKKMIKMYYVQVEFSFLINYRVWKNYKEDVLSMQGYM